MVRSPMVRVRSCLVEGAVRGMVLVPIIIVDASSARDRRVLESVMAGPPGISV